MPLNMNNAETKGKPRQLLEIGQQPCRIVQIVDLGLQNQRPYQGQEKPPAYEMYLTFEFPDSRIEVDGESRPMWKSKRLKLSNHEKSTCFKWYNKLDPQGKARGDWSQFLTMACNALIVHNQGKGDNAGRTFDDIADLNPLFKGQEVPPLENDPVMFDLGSPDKDVFERFPEWLQNIIKENLEFTGSKLQNMLEGNPTKYTARAPGDAPVDQDADDVSPEDVASYNPDVEDDDEPF